LITLMHSGTTSRPMSSPNRIPIFNVPPKTTPASFAHVQLDFLDIAFPARHFLAQPSFRVANRSLRRGGHSAFLKRVLHFRRAGCADERVSKRRNGRPGANFGWRRE